MMGKSNFKVEVADSDGGCGTVLYAYLGNVPIGVARLSWFGEPFSFVYLESLDIDHRFQGLGFGSKLLSHVNKFIGESGLPGLCYDGINDDGLAKGFYSRYGWEPRNVDSNGWYGLHTMNLHDEDLESAIRVIDNNGEIYTIEV